MNFFEKLLFYISVPKCVSCGKRLDINDVAICPECKKDYDNHKMRNCSSCSNILSRCTCTNDYLKAHSVKRLVKLFRYINRDNDENCIFASNMLIYSLKRDNRADVVKLLSDDISTAIENNVAPDKNNFLITSVPRRSRAVRRYGIDHAKQLARAISKRLDIPYVTLLKSTAKAPQKKMRKEERIKNATFDYVNNPPDVRGRRIIIVDDIVTTGASMGACAMLIRALGVKEVIGATVSIAYKDKTVDYINMKNGAHYR